MCINSDIKVRDLEAWDRSASLLQEVERLRAEYRRLAASVKKKEALTLVFIGAHMWGSAIFAELFVLWRTVALDFHEQQFAQLHLRIFFLARRLRLR